MSLAFLAGVMPVDPLQPNPRVSRGGWFALRRRNSAKTVRCGPHSTTRFELQGIEAGQHEMRFEHSGFQTRTIRVTVGGSEEVIEVGAVVLERQSAPRKLWWGGWVGSVAESFRHQDCDRKAEADLFVCAVRTHIECVVFDRILKDLSNAIRVSLFGK